jgi:hypothetical protein
MGSQRNIRQLQVSMLEQATTTNVGVTTSVIGSTKDSTGYRTGIFITEVRAASVGVSAHLYGCVNLGNNSATTSVWALIGTISTDLTTTANNQSVTIQNIPSAIKVQLTPATTSSNVRCSIRAELLSA